MDLQTLLTNKQLNAKAKTEAISNLLLDGIINVTELIATAEICKDKEMAIIIEALEFATRAKPPIGSLACLQFVTKTLTHNAPRVKWESAKVIANIAHLYPGKLNEAVKKLLVNTKDTGTVVRWSAAFALAEIVALKTSLHKDLIPAIESICKWEEKNSIRKIYIAALKKATI
jgi:HEAT repeat protein